MIIIYCKDSRSTHNKVLIEVKWSVLWEKSNREQGYLSVKDEEMLLYSLEKQIFITVIFSREQLSCNRSFFRRLQSYEELKDQLEKLIMSAFNTRTSQKTEFLSNRKFQYLKFVFILNWKVRFSPQVKSAKTFQDLELAKHFLLWSCRNNEITNAIVCY